MSLKNPDQWRLQSPQVTAVEAIVRQLAIQNAGGVDSATGFIYDGSGRLTEFHADGVLVTIAYPDAEHVSIVWGTHSILITLDAQRRVTSVERT